MDKLPLMMTDPQTFLNTKRVLDAMVTRREEKYFWKFSKTTSKSLLRRIFLFNLLWLQNKLRSPAIPKTDFLLGKKRSH